MNITLSRFHWIMSSQHFTTTLETLERRWMAEVWCHVASAKWYELEFLKTNWAER